MNLVRAYALIQQLHDTNEPMQKRNKEISLVLAFRTLYIGSQNITFSTKATKRVPFCMVKSIVQRKLFHTNNSTKAACVYFMQMLLKLAVNKHAASLKKKTRAIQTTRIFRSHLGSKNLRGNEIVRGINSQVERVNKRKAYT